LVSYPYTILPVNVSSVLEASLRDAKISPKPLTLSDLKSLNGTFHEEYHSSEEISTFLQELANAFPETTSLFHMGSSFEERPLEGIKIAKPKHGKQRHAFVILGPQHARDWVAVSTSLYLAHALAVDPSEQPRDQAGFTLGHLLDLYEFHIIPNPNPDGYEYTRTKDRLWYKNRQIVSHNGKIDCTGIDMNRNWVGACFETL
jgi:extracellular matrix protein 14